jgi:NAD(P)-dependent dehydrogenase (short-subunit alcohol dehydrogenase family)
VSPFVGRAARAVDTALDRSVVLGYSKLGLGVRRHLSSWPDDPAPGSLEGRHVLVTGASSGLGIATAQGLASLGATVHLVVRDLDKGGQVADRLRQEVPGASYELWRCDVGDLDDVRRFAGEAAASGLSFAGIVHNAGVMPPERTTSPQGHEQTMAVHVLGPVLMTELLLPHLEDDARVVLVTSGGMYTAPLPVDDPEYTRGDYKPPTAYARSKRVQVSLLPVLAQRWRTLGVHAMHPGWADTPGVVDSLPGFHKLTGPILRGAAQGADTSVWLVATEPSPESGLLWHDRRPRPEHLTKRTRETEADREAMWAWVREQTGIDL